MKKLILFYLIIGLVACGEDTERFVPLENAPTQEALIKLAPPLFENFKLDNTTTSIASQSNVNFDIDMNTFFEPSETVNESSYDLQLLEYKEFAQFLTQGLSSDAELGYSEIKYSFLIDANANDESLSIREGEHITVRIPSEDLGDIGLGKAFFKSETLDWSFNEFKINESIKFTSWKALNSDGQLMDVTGYEFKIYETGWYVMADIQRSSFELTDICIQLSEDYDHENTVTYILSKNNSYLFKLNNTESSDLQCGYNIPYVKPDAMILNVFYSDNKFFYNLEDIDLSLNQELVTVSSPKEISDRDLREIIESL